MTPFLRRRGRWLVILLLWLFWGRLLHAAAVKSDTFDEMFNVLSGALYWQYTPLEPVVQNPPLVSAIIGLPVSLLFQPTLPLEHPSWPTGDWMRIAQAFLWQINDNGWQMLWVARLATMSLALLLGALLYRWGRELSQSQTVAILLLFLYSFDPNILAHSTLAKADLGLTLFLTLATYLVWRYWQLCHGTRKNSGEHGETQNSKLTLYLLAGVGIGCALAAKFSGLIILPAVSLMAGYRWLSLGRDWSGFKRTIIELLGWFLLAGLFFLLVYRFDLTALAADFAREREHQLTGHSSYLLGQLSREGWWYYFPVVFMVKTPLPTLVLGLAAIIGFVKRGRNDWSLLWPLLVAGGIAGASLVSRVNIGYRYLLPALPLLYLFTAHWLGRSEWRVVGSEPRVAKGIHHASRIIFLIFLLWFSLDSLLIHPDYLAYFNVLGGGPENGWRIVVDSNIDWGQDIKPLGRYLIEHDITEPVYVAWLGTTPLSAYGINGTPLPAWPVASEEMLYSPFYPPRPAPGLYVLSVTQLLGVYLTDPARFAWFQQKEPDDKVGYSLFVYEVTAEGPAVGIALSGVGLADVALADFGQMVEGNGARPRWFDARSSFLWPGGTAGDAWAVVGEGHLPASPLLQTLYPLPILSGANGAGLRYRLYQWAESPLARLSGEAGFYGEFGYAAAAVVGAADWEAQRQPLPGDALFGDTFQLLGYIMGDSQPDQLTLMTTWRIRQPLTTNPAPSLKIFIHLLNAEGQVVAQYDGLDVRLTGLQPGDELAQLHQLPLPPELPPGPYALQIGLYEVETGARLTVSTPIGLVDRLLLHRLPDGK